MRTMFNSFSTKLVVLVLLICVAVSESTIAQKNYLDEAETAYKSMEYFEAIGLYKKAYAKEKNKATKAEIIFKTAECYRQANDIAQAVAWYKKTIKANYVDPIATRRLAEMLKVSGKYDEALSEYKEYMAKVPADVSARDGARACETAQEWKDNPTRYEVENVALINSRNNDFATAYSDKRKYSSLVFTSSREGSVGGKTDGWTGQSFTDLYETTRDRKGKWSTPTPLGETVNTGDNEGACVLNGRVNTLYFTRCSVEKGKQMYCKLYSTRKKGVTWDVPVLLPFSSDSFSVGHPSLATNDEDLFFSSDMPGGLGGKDIWKTTYDKRKRNWSKPENLGSQINTTEDDMFPFIHNDGTLYFSSNGHMGMGGLDIFKSPKNGNSWGPAENLKYPLNSEGDDYAIVFEGEHERGYFTSSRGGGKGGDDIYSFVLPPMKFTLQGIVTDVDSREILVDSKVELLGSDGTSLSVNTDDNGAYYYDLSPETNYVLKASKTGYLSDGGEESTVGEADSKDFIHNFALKFIPKEKKAEIKLPLILYEFDKWDITVQAKDSLQGLLKTLRDNDNIVIELRSHTDSRGSDAYNQQLSQKRAQSVVDYLIAEGIDGDRMVAKGYGESLLKVTDVEIKKLKNEEEREAAHQLNRRTAFSVLKTDYVPKGEEDENPEEGNEEDKSNQGDQEKSDDIKTTDEIDKKE